MVSVTISDSRLVAIKAELLHGIPELTGAQINRAAFIALAAIDRFDQQIAAQVAAFEEVMRKDRDVLQELGDE
jgi:hypothetical protein